MVYNREEAARRAEASTTNTPGWCQLWTRNKYDGASAGDQDRDGDADAVDGWKSEPVSARHTDRNPPRGVPVAFRGGSNGFGHRAISLGGGKIRSTDMRSDGRYNKGTVATVTIDQIERAMNVDWLGWSDTITGVPIPLPPKPDEPETTRVLLARRLLTRALQAANNKGKTTRAAKIQKALDVLPRR